MAEGEDKDQKTEAPSAKRLEDAEKKGDVAIAQDVKHLAMFIATLVLILGGLQFTAEILARASISFWGRAETFNFSPEGIKNILYAMLGIMAKALAIPLLITIVCAFIAAGLQGKLVMSSQRITPQLSRISLIGGLKRVVGGKALIQFAKTLAKLGVVGAAIWVVVPDIQTLVLADTPTVGGVVRRILGVAKALLWAVVIAAAVVALLDMVWSKFEFLKRMRMSREDLKKEMKDADGDPHIRAKRKQLAMQRSRRRSIAAVEKSSVLMMNPTHYAVALQYEHGVSAAPVVVAKGMDRLALAMRDKAEELGIPVVVNPPLARALHANVEVDHMIPADLFEDVAEVISYVMSLERR